jgi:hypothetical protein
VEAFFGEAPVERHPDGAARAYEVSDPFFDEEDLEPTTPQRANALVA